MATQTLLYRIVGHNGGLVFATQKRAEYVARIHRALRMATTWAQFRSLVPRKEYSEIIASFDYNGEPRPKGADDFSPDSVPGFNDGDYPPWLQQQMCTLLPRTLLERFGTLVATHCNGPYWHIDPKVAPDMVKALVAIGFTVKESPELAFH